MSNTATYTHPTTAQLLKATILAIVIAGVVLITTVLPAEYGIDPTGLGKKLGLGVLSAGHTAEAKAEPVSSDAKSQAVAEPSTVVNDNSEIAAKAEVAFGSHKGQSFDPDAVSLRPTPFRNDSLSLTLEPGKGAEIKVLLKTGEGIVFHWKASADVALDMHGERPGATENWTSYAIESAQSEAAGTFIAPFDGSHGWYWQNRSKEKVAVEIKVAGQQEKLYRP
jgi:hypothetical protein